MAIDYFLKVSVDWNNGYIERLESLIDEERPKSYATLNDAEDAAYLLAGRVVRTYQRACGALCQSSVMEEALVAIEAPDFEMVIGIKRH